MAPNLIVVEVEDLVKRFGNFVAVDHISFQVGGWPDLWFSWTEWFG